MNTATDHYSRLLAPIYLWMAGGPQSALSSGTADLSAAGITPSSGTTAIDLGCGFGMHAIPLARLGYAVTAIDSSPILLAALRQIAEGLEIRAVECDLLEFTAHLEASPALILCMGDTLTHLSNPVDVDNLCSMVTGSLTPGGKFVTTFRDYTRPASGNARFITVRSDAERIHTCFLEEESDHIRVHDIVHERRDENWLMRVSSYPKLKLSPDLVARHFESHGLRVAKTQGPRGMVQIIAVKSS
jgi:SAM-dependent methyltransferase